MANEAHQQLQHQDMLDGFMKKFVLCEKCENPEMVIKVKKNMIRASQLQGVWRGHTYIHH